MSKKHGMMTYSLSEVKDALSIYGFQLKPGRGKGSHRIYSHMVFDDLISFELSNHGEVSKNIYQQMVGALAVLSLVTDASPSMLADKNLHKLKKDVETNLANQQYRTFLIRLLRGRKDENGQAYDSDAQLKKFLDELSERYKKWKKNQEKNKGGNNNENDW